MTKDELKNKINSLAQFPYNQRSQSYQAYWLHDEGWIKGTRDALYRFNVMGITEDLSGKSVLDLGCQLGVMGMECCRRGATNVLGVEYQPEYVECARDLAEYNNFKNITFIQGDLTKGDEVPKIVNKHFDNKPVDICLALSLYKHVKEPLFNVLSKIKFKTLYIESHNTGTTGIQTPHVVEMLSYMKKYSLEPVTFIGFTTDRSPRAVWRISHESKVF